jgi:PTS system nitrogen regulatory IIA component
MKITEILKPDFIIPSIKSTDKKETLLELADFLKEKGAIENKQNLNLALLEREKLGSTGIGENVAIPHAKCDEVQQIMTVFGRSTKGIEFESLDQKPVFFICLLLAPTNSTGQHLKALARIARLMKSKTLREEILTAQDEKKIYSLLLDEDSKFI